MEDRNYGCLPTFGSPMDLSSFFESLNCTTSVVSNSNMGLSVINWVFLRVFV